MQFGQIIFDLRLWNLFHRFHHVFAASVSAIDNQDISPTLVAGLLSGHQNAAIAPMSGRQLTAIRGRPKTPNWSFRAFGISSTNLPVTGASTAMVNMPVVPKTPVSAAV